MAVGNVILYDGATELFKSSSRQWDDPATGNIMFILANHTYTPNISHATVANVSYYIPSGDGAPINATSLAMNTQTGVNAGDIYCTSDAANFGSSVTITAKYLICVQPVTAGTLASTSKLIFYVDLDTTSSSTDVSTTAGQFTIIPSASGWFKIDK